MPDHPDPLINAKAVLMRASKKGRSPEDLAEARRVFHEMKTKHYIEKCLAEAPPLGADQLARLAALLKPAE